MDTREALSGVLPAEFTDGLPGPRHSKNEEAYNARGSCDGHDENSLRPAHR